MPNYRRWRIAGGAYFFTVVTANRRPILTTDLGRGCFRAALEAVRIDLPFELLAIVLLPDHAHCIWNLPAGDDNFSVRWARVKSTFTRYYLAGGGQEAPISESRRKKGERSVWQRRFWEHVIREEDSNHCMDYVHYNPVKHGLVARVKDWPWSSFHRYVRLGEYAEDWGAGIDVPYNADIFGEHEFA